MAQRPTFLSIICILLALLGIIMLVVGAVLVGSSDVLKDAFANLGVDVESSFFVAMGAIALIFGLLALLVSYLLWKGNKLGWYLVFVVLILNAIFGILALPAGLVEIVITIFLIWYFLRPKVRAYFGV